MDMVVMVCYYDPLGMGRERPIKWRFGQGFWRRIGKGVSWLG